LETTLEEMATSALPTETNTAPPAALLLPGLQDNDVEDDILLLKLQLEKNGREFEAIWFNHADTLPDKIRAAYRLDINEYNGRSRVQLLVEFAEPA
jgi:hypothetical protein